jgi:hypothetical protein
LIAGADEDEVDISWRACGSFDSGGTFGGGMQYGEREPDEGCGGGGFAVPLGEASSAVLPGELTRALFDNLELAAVILGTTLPENALDRIRRDVGIPFLIEADVRAGEKRIRTVKRVLVRETEASRPAHQNPPPPRFLLGEIEIAGARESFSCSALDGVTPRVPRASDVEVQPILEEGEEEEAWLEPYQVLDAQGELQDRSERAYYSWFADGGRLDQQLTRAPLRNEVWTTPDAPGMHTLWSIVRDGRGGTSACGLQVIVE